MDYFLKHLLIDFFSRFAMMYYSSAIISKIFMSQLQFVSSRRESIYHVDLFYLDRDVFGDLSPSRENNFDCRDVVENLSAS